VRQHRLHFFHTQKTNLCFSLQINHLNFLHPPRYYLYYDPLIRVFHFQGIYCAISLFFSTFSAFHQDPDNTSLTFNFCPPFKCYRFLFIFLLYFNIPELVVEVFLFLLFCYELNVIVITFSIPCENAVVSSFLVKAPNPFLNFVI